MDDDQETRIDGFAAVVLAAGISARMGRNKLLMEMAGRPMIRHVVETVHGVADDVIVVIGHQGERISEALARVAVRYVSVDPTLGQAASIAAGLSEARPTLATLVCVGDQPRLTEREIAGLAERWLAGDRSKVLVPMQNEVRGWPMVVPAGFRLDLDLAAPNLAMAHADCVAVFPTKNPVYASSVDTPEDWRALFAI